MPDKMDPQPSPYGDFVLPFDIAKAGVRGRMVRLDASSARALGAHALPEPAARVTGEVVALGGAAGHRPEAGRPADHPDQGRWPARPGDRRLLWRRREPPIAAVRGYARLDAERFATLVGAQFDKLAGKGALAITIEPSWAARPIRASWNCRPRALPPAPKPYFSQSEQLPTVIKLPPRRCMWRAIPCPTGGPAASCCR